MHLRSQPQLQVVEPPDLIYFRFVIIIISVFFCVFFFCISMLSRLLPVFLFCSGHFSLTQLFFEDVTASHSGKGSLLF